MSILGKYVDNIEEQEFEDNKGYTLPAVLREDRDSISMEKAFVLSVLFHTLFVILAVSISFLLTWLGIIIPISKRPQPKLNDIEFVLVEKEDTPINKNTPYRAHINSRAGGHHDPKQKVSMPSPAPSAPSKPKAASAPSSSPKKASKPVQKQKPQAQSVFDKIMKPVEKTVQKTPQPSVPTPAPKAPQVSKPNPPTARPSLKPPMTPKTVQKPSSAFKVPVPSGGTKSGSYATGPVSGSGKAIKGGGSSSGSSSGGGKFAPAPALSPTGRGSGASSGSKLGHGTGGSGGYGNPGPGNPNGRPGIDAIREPDFGPYMRELQRRIKMNWNPPKGNESKRVVLLFKIAKDGRLLSCSVFKSSGLPNADKAALDAVKLTAPFKPLPVEYKGSSIDIQFTFDYNVFGATGY